MVCFSLLSSVEGLEGRDKDRADLCRWGVLFCVSGKLSAQAKVDLDQLVVPGVAGPHGWKYFPDGKKVLFHGPLLNGNPAGCQKAGAHMLGKDMK